MERYRILKKLAEGGSGETFLVWDKHLEKEWVMKCISFQCAGGGDAWRMEAAKQEIKVLRQLRIKGVPMLVDAFYEAESMCLILEYMRGISLEERIRRDGAMQDAEAVSCALSLAGILRQMHELRTPLLHGDIKPLNIIWKEGSVSLLDFGTAVFAYGAAAYEGGKCCTPGYAAPELQRGGKLSAASDIYAFGAVLAYLLVGMPTEKGYGGERCLEGLQNPLLKAIVLKCIRTAPEQRYHAMSEVEQALLEAEKSICRKGNKSLWKREGYKRKREKKFQIIESLLLTDGKC